MKPLTKEYPFPADYPPARVLHEAMSALDDAMAMDWPPHLRYYLSTAYRVLEDAYKKEST